MIQSINANAAFMPSTVTGPAPRMSLRGKIWLDETGVPLKKPLRGWNWGHWGRSLEAHAIAHVNEGAGVVRIILRWKGPYPAGLDSYSDTAPGFIDPAFLQQLDQYIAWCVSRGLRVILTRDCNCGQDGTQPGSDPVCTIGGIPNSNFWNNLPFRQQFWAGWAMLAARYRHVPGIAMLEVMPEPAPPNVPASQVRDFYAEGIATIRAADPDTIILIGGPAAYKLAKTHTVYDPSFRNVAYTADILGPQCANTTTLADNYRAFTDVRDDNDVGIFIQQVGCESSRDPSNIYLPAALDMLIEDGTGFTVWEYQSPTEDSYGPLPSPGATWSPKTAVYDAIVSRF